MEQKVTYLCCLHWGQILTGSMNNIRRYADVQLDMKCRKIIVNILRYAHSPPVARDENLMFENKSKYFWTSVQSVHSNRLVEFTGNLRITALFLD